MPIHPTTASAHALWRRLARRLDPPEVEYRLVAWLFLRALGGVYAVAFLALALQLRPLLGRGGLLPVHLFLERVAGSGPAPWWQVPSLMWLSSADGFMVALAWVGVGLSLLLLGGHATALHLVALWALYSSFVNVGQLFYGYGWEILLLEAGFLAAFLPPAWRGGWRAAAAPPPRAVLWLLRWLLFRVMFGAGLIKLRGDPCWRDLTCLLYHFETQPIPNPASPFFHHLPALVLRAGAAVNHLVEVVVPFLLFAPPRVRWLASGLTALFQGVLTASGNLSWLNYLTITLCLPCLDDRVLWRVLPARLLARAATARPEASPVPVRPLVVGALVAIVAVLSVGPMANLLSSEQVMNTSFDRLHLVNAYGAFGHVGKVRREVILLGTLDATPDESADWREYGFPCKPGDPARRPCVLAPYHLRLDWQIWFAAMADVRSQPWLVHLVYQLLHADPGALSLLAGDPFAGARPRWIRADLYEYAFAPPGDAGWWHRRRIGAYLRPLSADDPDLRRAVDGFGWPLRSAAPADPGSGTPAQVAGGESSCACAGG